MRNNSCVCQNHYFLNDSTCDLCHNSCERCNGSASTNCLECRPELYFTSESLCLCDTSFYWNGSECLTCESEKNLIASKYECICRDGYYLESDICQPCSTFCKTCFGGLANQCWSCDNNSDLNDSECICSKRFYKGENNCLDCYPLCDYCIGPSLKDCLCEENGILGC